MRAERARGPLRGSAAFGADPHSTWWYRRWRRRAAWWLLLLPGSGPGIGRRPECAHLPLGVRPSTAPRALRGPLAPAVAERRICRGPLPTAGPRGLRRLSRSLRRYRPARSPAPCH